MSWRPRQRPPERRRDPVRARGGIARVLGELGLDAERTRRLDAALAAALGPALAPHFEIVDLRGRSLEVAADAPAFSQELTLRRSAVLAALREALGPDAPAELRVRIRRRG